MEVDVVGVESQLLEITAFYSRIENAALTRESTVEDDVPKDIGSISLEDPDGSSLLPADGQILYRRILETQSESYQREARICPCMVT